MLQRYAMLGMSNPNPSGSVCAMWWENPSSMLYLTPDRPWASTKPRVRHGTTNRYGLQRSSINYAVIQPLVAPALFRSYAAKEVRYVVGLNDRTRFTAIKRAWLMA